MDGFICIASKSADSSQCSHFVTNEFEHIALNTCERNEFYMYAQSEVASQLALDGNECIRILYGESAAHHLLRVAAGLESRIVGEPHVLGQVRKAFTKAELRGMSGTNLATLFRAALRTGKRVRSETSLNVANESVETLATQRMFGALGTLNDRCIGVVGTGEVARGVARALVDSGVRRIFVFSRSCNRMGEINWPRTHAMRLDDLAGVMGNLDGLIACSKLNQPIINANHLASCSDGFPVIDLGSPPNVGDLHIVAAKIVLTRLAELERAAPDAQVRLAESIVAEELLRLDQWFRHRTIAGSIERMVREANLPPQRSTPTLHAKIMRAKAQVAA